MPRSPQFEAAVKKFKARMGKYIYSKKALLAPGKYRYRFAYYDQHGASQRRIDNVAYRVAASKIQRNWRVKRSKVNRQKPAKYQSPLRRHYKRQFRST